MSAASIALLGAIAGLTIFLGLPIGRVRSKLPRTRALLNALAIGILVFLLWDVIDHAWAPAAAALGQHRYAAAVRDGAVMLGCVGTGLLGLVYFDRWVARRARRTRPPGAPSPPRPAAPVHPSGPARPHGPGAALAGAGQPAGYGWLARAARAVRPGATTSAGASAGGRVRSPGKAARSGGAPRSGNGARPAGGAGPAAARLSLLIAIGIGLHNFGEGLAIGDSAAAGELSLALLLVIGFGAHNATEGFGIVAPLAAAGERPSWGRLGILGLIGGGPTFLGTLVGEQVTSDLLSIAFLALAAGSILYVVIELLAVARVMALKEITTWGILLGLTLGFVTDAIVTAAGG
jgi:zinc transporter, ZIP family